MKGSHVVIQQCLNSCYGYRTAFIFDWQQAQLQPNYVSAADSVCCYIGCYNSLNHFIDHHHHHRCCSPSMQRAMAEELLHQCRYNNEWTIYCLCFSNKMFEWWMTVVKGRWKWFVCSFVRFLPKGKSENSIAKNINFEKWNMKWHECNLSYCSILHDLYCCKDASFGICFRFLMQPN